MNKHQEYFSVKDLSLRYRVSNQTIWYWLRKGKLNKPIKLGANSTRWKLIDVERCEAERSEESA